MLLSTIPPVILGFALGGLSYTTANYILTKRSKGHLRRRKSSHGNQAGGGKNFWVVIIGWFCYG